jgi:hypothetical protein
VNEKTAIETLEREKAELRRALVPFIPEAVLEMSAHDVVTSPWIVPVTGVQMFRAREALKAALRGKGTHDDGRTASG